MNIGKLKYQKENNEGFYDPSQGDQFKGIFHNVDSEKQYYEGGAHFAYSDLCSKLEKIKKSRDKESKPDDYLSIQINNLVNNENKHFSRNTRNTGVQNNFNTINFLMDQDNKYNNRKIVLDNKNYLSDSLKEKYNNNNFKENRFSDKEESQNQSQGHGQNLVESIMTFNNKKKNNNHNDEFYNELRSNSIGSIGSNTKIQDKFKTYTDSNYGNNSNYLNKNSSTVDNDCKNINILNNRKIYTTIDFNSNEENKFKESSKDSFKGSGKFKSNNYDIENIARNEFKENSPKFGISNNTGHFYETRNIEYNKNQQNSNSNQLYTQNEKKGILNSALNFTKNIQETKDLLYEKKNLKKEDLELTNIEKNKKDQNSQNSFNKPIRCNKKSINYDNGYNSINTKFENKNLDNVSIRINDKFSHQNNQLFMEERISNYNIPNSSNSNITGSEKDLNSIKNFSTNDSKNRLSSKETTKEMSLKSKNKLENIDDKINFIIQKISQLVPDEKKILEERIKMENKLKDNDSYNLSKPNKCSNNGKNNISKQIDLNSRNKNDNIHLKEMISSKNKNEQYNYKHNANKSLDLDNKSQNYNNQAIYSTLSQRGVNDNFNLKQLYQIPQIMKNSNSCQKIINTVNTDKGKVLNFDYGKNAKTNYNEVITQSKSPLIRKNEVFDKRTINPDSNGINCFNLNLNVKEIKINNNIKLDKNNPHDFNQKGNLLVSQPLNKNKMNKSPNKISDNENNSQNNVKYDIKNDNLNQNNTNKLYTNNQNVIGLENNRSSKSLNYNDNLFYSEVGNKSELLSNVLKNIKKNMSRNDNNDFLNQLNKFTNIKDEKFLSSRKTESKNYNSFNINSNSNNNVNYSKSLLSNSKLISSSNNKQNVISNSNSNSNQVHVNKETSNKNKENITNINNNNQNFIHRKIQSNIPIPKYSNMGNTNSSNNIIKNSLVNKERVNLSFGKDNKNILIDKFVSKDNSTHNYNSNGNKSNNANNSKNKYLVSSNSKTNIIDHSINNNISKSKQVNCEEYDIVTNRTNKNNLVKYKKVEAFNPVMLDIKKTKIHDQMYGKNMHSNTNIVNEKNLNTMRINNVNKHSNSIINNNQNTLSPNKKNLKQNKSKSKIY